LRVLAHGPIQALDGAPSGLIKVVVRTGDLRQSPLCGGSPATLAKKGKRFEEWFDQRVPGKEPWKVRILPE
jgi:hypothetical protein